MNITQSKDYGTFWLVTGDFKGRRFTSNVAKDDSYIIIPEQYLFTAYEFSALKVGLLAYCKGLTDCIDFLDEVVKRHGYDNSLVDRLKTIYSSKGDKREYIKVGDNILRSKTVLRIVE